MTTDIPPAIRIALRVLLNHVEPGWENSVKFVELWLDGGLQAPETDCVEGGGGQG